MLGQYKLCMQCDKLEHHRRKSDQVCEKCETENKRTTKRKVKKQEEDQNYSVLF